MDNKSKINVLARHLRDLKDVASHPNFDAAMQTFIEDHKEHLPFNSNHLSDIFVLLYIHVEYSTTMYIENDEIRNEDNDGNIYAFREGSWVNISDEY